ncbi:galectin-7-like [Candoia aspera]|uniref:galectin-7-like n=1 Tax=Candoia aspera TaxID=51853 RepID=UPI002FD7A16C
MAQTSGDKKRTPYCTDFPEGLAAGQQLKMEASLPKDCVSFMVNFLCGKEEKANSALLLLFTLGDPNMVILNNILDKTFGKEETLSNVPLARGENFDLIFIIEKEGYKVLINGEEFCQRKHYISAEQVRFLQVEGDVDVKGVKLAGEKEKEVEGTDGEIKVQSRCMVMCAPSFGYAPVMPVCMPCAPCQPYYYYNCRRCCHCGCFMCCC